MPAFDFFAELASTASSPWLALALSASHTKPASPPRPVLHDLSLDFISFPQRSPAPSPMLAPSPVQIPLELILAIIEAGSPDPALLQTCSLVCRAWSVSVQKLLFTSVSLSTDRAFAAFSAAVGPDTQHARVLRNAIRQLHVVMDFSQPSYLPQRAFAQAVAMCPNLQDLDIAIYGFAEPQAQASPFGSVESSRLRRHAPAFDNETMSILCSGPSIKSLSFSNWSENQQCISQLLGIWPSLQALSMSGTPPHLLPSHSTAPFPGALQELRINFQAAPSLIFMGWLLHNSSASLRSLTFERDPCPDLFKFMMSSFGRDLRSLSIPNCTTSDHSRTVSSCNNLRFLRMDRPQPNPLAYKSVPAAINHLALGVDRDTPLQPVIEVVKSRKALEMVTIRLWNGGDNHHLLPALKIACAYRGVDLSLTHDSQEYKSLTRC